MTLEIGKAYRLPRLNVPALYIGWTEQGHAFSYIENERAWHKALDNPDKVTTWREPRKWEVEVFAFEAKNGDMMFKAIKSDEVLTIVTEANCVARHTVLVQEIMEG